MPHVNRIEAKLIGTALFAGQEEREQLFRTIEPEQFSDKASSKMFKKLRNAFESNPEADYEMLISTLDREDYVLILTQLNELPSPSIAREQLPSTLALFRGEYQNRLIRECADKVLTGELEEKALTDLVRQFGEQQNLPRVNTAEKYLAEYSQKVEFFKTGFKELDEALGGGLLRGTLATIGARPSTGKTALALNLASYIALSRPECKVMFVSIEMTSRMIYDRLISSLKDVPLGVSVRHEVSFETVQSIVDSLPNLIVIDDVSNIGIIEELIYSEKPDVVLIDFVQIITSSRRFPDNRQRIDFISQKLKTAAKKVDCSVVMLSQITRSGKDSPTMSDLKESGGLEQDSDYIILLYREYVNNKGADVDPEATEVILDKNKFGRTAEINLRFKGTYQRFEDEGEIAKPITAEEVDDDLPF